MTVEVVENTERVGRDPELTGICAARSHQRCRQAIDWPIGMNGESDGTIVRVNGSDDGRTIERGTEVVVIRYERGIAYVRPWAELEGDQLAGLPNRP